MNKKWAENRSRIYLLMEMQFYFKRKNESYERKSRPRHEARLNTFGEEDLAVDDGFKSPLWDLANLSNLSFMFTGT